MAVRRLFVAVDVGTSGARAVAFDATGERIAECRRSYGTSVPRPGWAEQDASDWSSASLQALADLADAVDPADIASIGLTGQTPTVVAVDDRMEPLGPGMLYRDNRAVAEAEEMQALLGREALHRRTGHTPAAFHVAPKLLWLLRHEPAVIGRARWFLQPRDVVLHRLTGIVTTDETHAAATAFFDLRERRWATDLIEALGLDPTRFPPALPPWTVVGPLECRAAAACGLLAGTPVVVGGGDSQCAAYGSGVVDVGPASEMAGSSSCINTVVLEPLEDLRITHYSHVVPERYTTEVGLNTTGAAIRWAVQTLGFDSYEALAEAAVAGRRAVAAAGGGEDAAVAAAPFFIPALGDGERDNPSARGALIDLRDSHDRAAIAFAIVEGVAAAVTGRVELLRRAGSPVTELRVAGGGTRLRPLGQAKADLLGVPVVHLDVDTAGLGAAMLGARGAGFVDDASAAIAATHRRARRFQPDPDLALGSARRRQHFEERT